VNHGRSPDLQPAPSLVAPWTSLRRRPPPTFARAVDLGRVCGGGGALTATGSGAIRSHERLGVGAISLVGAKKWPTSSEQKQFGHRQARQVASEHRLTTKLKA
jgi:hypothetical protein